RAADPLPAAGRAWHGDRGAGADAVCTPAGGGAGDDLLYLRLREHGYGQWYSARRRCAAAILQLWRHGVRDAGPRRRNTDEHPAASQADAELNAAHAVAFRGGAMLARLFLRPQVAVVLSALTLLLLAGCSTTPLSGSSSSKPAQTAGSTKSTGYPTLPAAGSGRGGYYLDDGPGDDIPEGLLDVADAEPRIEPYS